jgi:hypothetical protein
MDSSTLWRYREATGFRNARDLSGLKVEARDGDIGKVDEATDEVGASYIVVDTGPWIFGKKVVLPAGVIERIDVDDSRIVVSLTKDQIKDSPEYDPNTYRSENYRSRLGSYYTDMNM